MKSEIGAERGRRAERVCDDAPVDERDGGGRDAVYVADHRGSPDRWLAAERRQPGERGLVRLLGGSNREGIGIEHETSWGGFPGGWRPIAPAAARIAV